MNLAQRAVRGRTRQARLPGMTQATPDTPLTLTMGALQQWHAALQRALANSETPEALEYVAAAIGQLVQVESMMISLSARGARRSCSTSRAFPSCTALRCWSVISVPATCSTRSASPCKAAWPKAFTTCRKSPRTTSSTATITRPITWHRLQRRQLLHRRSQRWAQAVAEPVPGLQRHASECRAGRLAAGAGADGAGTVGALCPA